MRSSILIVFLLVVGGSSFGKNWPLSDQALEEVLHRDSRWTKLSQEIKSETRSNLVYALHLAGSLEARKAFFDYMNKLWDSNVSLNEKQQMLKEAELLAQESARKAVKKWVEAKNSRGKPISAKAIIYQLTSGNLATERFHEWDRFLTNQGEINYKSWPLGANPSLPEEVRPPVDLMNFLSSLYPGSPARRKEEAMKLSKAYESAWGRGLPTGGLYGTQSDGTHSGNTSIRACGTPSSNAATLRPELNGR